MGCSNICLIKINSAPLLNVLLSDSCVNTILFCVLLHNIKYWGGVLFPEASFTCAPHTKWLELSQFYKNKCKTPPENCATLSSRASKKKETWFLEALKITSGNLSSRDWWDYLLQSVHVFLWEVFTTQTAARCQIQNAGINCFNCSEWNLFVSKISHRGFTDLIELDVHLQLCRP